MRGVDANRRLPRPVLRWWGAPAWLRSRRSPIWDPGRRSGPTSASKRCGRAWSSTRSHSPRKSISLPRRSNSGQPIRRSGATPCSGGYAQYRRCERHASGWRRSAPSSTRGSSHGRWISSSAKAPAQTPSAPSNPKPSRFRADSSTSCGRSAVRSLCLLTQGPSSSTPSSIRGSPNTLSVTSPSSANLRLHASRNNPARAATRSSPSAPWRNWRSTSRGRRASIWPISPDRFAEKST